MKVARAQINVILANSWRIFNGQTGRIYDYLIRGEKKICSGLLLSELQAL
jgi:hypothetical protein